MKRLNLNDVDSETLVEWIELADAELDQMKSDLNRLLQAVEFQTRDKSRGVA